MKKILFSAATIFAANFAFGQLTLEHTYNTLNSRFGVYYDANNTFYVINTSGNTFQIYNNNHTLYKTFTASVPSGYTEFEGEISNRDYSVSRYVFNTNTKLEFVMHFYNSTLGNSVTLIVDEDGNTIKNFGIDYDYNFVVFHDAPSNTNKFMIGKDVGANSFLEVYSLPTSALTTKEIQTKGKLSAFPVPTNKILNIFNPQNGANKIEVFDASGKLVKNQSFTTSENKISMDVENLPKGIYIYKVGELSSKFIKN